MAIVRWNPFQDLVSLQERMNRLFEQTLDRSRGEREVMVAGTWAPAVDIYETPESIVLQAELPGLGKDDIDIQVRDNVLTLKGERRSEKEVKEGNYLRVERAYGGFQRAFTLPAAVQADKIRAVFKDGVLDVSIPKAEEAKPKQIKIEVK
ncbi:MAG: Hsp20/alpha crystallin family protein [candidate division NC10 bacterium]|nr:Hsp20/alpha crystallin family protein [candidate division NC10 bacterium]